MDTPEAAGDRTRYSAEAWTVAISAVLTALLTCALYWLVGS